MNIELNTPILAGVVLLWQLYWAIRLDSSAVTQGFAERFVKDIRHRARLGQFPDWTFYELTLERKMTELDEELRSRSSACLTFGVLFTLAGVTAVAWRVGSLGDFGSLKSGAGLALASNAGLILGGLIIQRLIAPFKLNRASAAVESLMDQLRQEASLSDPETRDKGAELEMMTDAVKGGLRELPDILTLLAEQLYDAEKSRVASQMELKKLTDILSRASDKISSSLAALEPLTNSVSSLQTQLEKFPRELAGSLESAKSSFDAPITLAITELGRVTSTLTQFQVQFNEAVRAAASHQSTEFGKSFATNFQGAATGHLGAVNQTLIDQLAAQETTLNKMHAAHLGQVAQYASNNAQALADAAKLAFETIAPALIAQTKVPIDRITMQLQEAAETMKRAAVSIETENVEQRDFLREVSDAYLNANK